MLEPKLSSLDWELHFLVLLSLSIVQISMHTLLYLIFGISAIYEFFVHVILFLFGVLRVVDFLFACLVAGLLRGYVIKFSREIGVWRYVSYFVI
jgi:hypothetical protein